MIRAAVEGEEAEATAGADLEAVTETGSEDVVMDEADVAEAEAVRDNELD